MDKGKPVAGRSLGGPRSGGNFKNDPKRAADAGRQGGSASHTCGTR